MKYFPVSVMVIYGAETGENIPAEAWPNKFVVHILSTSGKIKKQSR